MLVMSLSMSVNAVNDSKTVIKGVLVDSLTRQGEPFATIRISKKSDPKNYVALAATGKDGDFKQTITGKGEFIITFSSVGRATVIKNFKLNGEKEYDFGTINISDDVQQLGDVTVTALKPLVTMETDKLKYNVSEDPDSKSYTLLDMLRKVPMVTVDGNDNITVNGSSSFKVLVNGQPNAMMNSNPSVIFKSLPASTVSKIEVITNPGAKYDAEGVGGVLNIIINKSPETKNATNGSNVSLQAVLNNRGWNGTAYASVQEGKFSMSVNATTAHMKINDLSTDMLRTQFGTGGNSTIGFKQNMDNKSHTNMGNFDASYEIDSLRLITASFGVMGYSNNVNGNGLNTLKGGYYGNGFSYSSIKKTNSSNYSIDGNVNYQRSYSTPGRILTLSYQISTNPNRNNSYNSYDNEGNTFLDLTDRHLNEHTNTVENTFQLDFSTPVGVGKTLDAGAKYISRNNSSNSKYYLMENNSYVFNGDQSLNYRHNNDILAAYTEYAANGKKFGFKAGLRYEYTLQHVKYLSGNGSDFNLNYGNLVPSASLTWNISQMSNLGMTYNLRINRPGITYLNPYINTQDPTSISYGNTNIKSEQTHNIGVVYNSFTPKFMMNIKANFESCNNGIGQYSFYKDNVLNTTFGNVAHRKNSSIFAFINWAATKSTRIYMNSGVSYVDLSNKNLDLKNHGWQGNMYLGLQQTLPWNLKLGPTIMVRTKQYTLQGWQGGFTMGSITLSKDFLKDKLNVTLLAFSNIGKGDMKMKTFDQGSDYESCTTVKIPLHIVGISLRYTFGSRQATVKKTSHSITNDDLINKKSDNEQVGNMMKQ